MMLVRIHIILAYGVYVRVLTASGAAGTAAYAWMALGALPLGSPMFFAAVAAAVLAYGAALSRIPRIAATRSVIIAAALLTLAMRAPLALAPVGSGSDIMRYVWDARVQRAGLSPYDVLPNDPALDRLHTPETRQMNNSDIPSPYPPGAQLFFRLATLPGESAMAVKLALAACDLATIVVIVLWLRRLDRSPLLAIAYAWNPLVVLEIAGSGHLDAAGMLAAAVAAFALTRGRIAVSVAALAAGVAIKFLPIVLVPLWWGRARLRHAALFAGLLAAVYLLFTDVSGQAAPVGSLTDMVRAFRFNGPVFKALAFLTSPWVAAGAGVAAGLACAALLRRSRLHDDPAAFAWPMAAALVCSPVVYPWYLLWLTPFFISRLTWPLILWSVLILPTYIVWPRAAAGGEWAVPIWMGLVEYAALAVATVALVRLQLSNPVTLHEEVRRDDRQQDAVDDQDGGRREI